jgi:hypothetical protein
MRGHAGLRLTDGVTAHGGFQVRAHDGQADGLTVTLRPDRHNERDEDSLSGLTAKAAVLFRIRNSD